MNKKGIFFTGMALIVLTFFFVTYTFYDQIQDRKVVQNRIKTMNNFVFSIEEDLERQAYISGFRAIFISESKVTEKGKYLNNITQTFEELFFNGTIDNEIQPLMHGATYSDILNSINQKSEKINAFANISNTKIKISQDDPWNVKVIINLSLYIKDKSDLVSWEKNKEIIAYIPITSFEDPLYIINTNGLVTNNISKTPFTSFISESDISNLTIHLNRGYYIENPSAPSFLNRIQGLNKPDINGIESLVNLDKLATQGIPIKDKSVVDYIYFSSDNPPTTTISQMPLWFKLDQNHIEIYNVSQLN